MSTLPSISAKEALEARIGESATRMRPLSRVISRSQRLDQIFNIVGWTLLVLSLSTLALLLWDLGADGLSRINWQFLMSFPSSDPAEAGIRSPWVGSLLIMLVTASTAIPLGIGAGIYLEEYAKKNKLTTLIEVNISNLAGVPSIIYGLMALGLLIYTFDLGQSILTGGITLGFLVLPIVIVATREALRAIPQAIREAAYGLGASKWQVIRQHLLPYSLGGISTGVIIALSRAIGETAPLITIGALTFIAFLPSAPLEEKPWLFDERAGMVVSVDEPMDQAKIDWDLSLAQSSERPERLNAEFTSGRIEVWTRERQMTSDVSVSDSSAKSQTLEFDLSPGSPARTVRGFAAELNRFEGLTAEIDEFSGGRLSIRADDGVEFCFAKDETGVLEALHVPPGGGRYGPFAWLQSGFTVLPIQMFNWVSRPGEEFMANAAAAGMVLMIVTLGMNTVAIVLRYRLRKKIKW